MRNEMLLAVALVTATTICSENSLAQQQQNTIVEQSDLQNLQRIKITSKIADEVEIVYGCLKATGRQAENIASVVGADHFFDVGFVREGIFKFLPSALRANLRKIELVKDDAYCAMAVGRERTDRGFVSKRISKKWTGNLVIMTFDEAGKKHSVLGSTVFCPKISKRRVCYKTAQSEIKFQDGKFWYKGQEVKRDENIISGVAGCFSLVDKQVGTRHSVVAYLGTVPEGIKDQVNKDNSWSSLSTQSCFERGFRVGE
jgi:hypothetical protein